MIYNRKTEHIAQVAEDKKPVKKGRPLDSKLKQTRFAYLYALHGDWSAKRCAIEAGYSASSAGNTAVSLLKKQPVLDLIEKAKEENPLHIVRKPAKWRRDKYTEYYEKAYKRKFTELLGDMGWWERECVERRQDITLKRKWRRQGNRDYNIIHKQCAQFAIDYCDKLFGPLNRKKMRWDPLARKWHYRSVVGCAYKGGM